MKDFIKIMEKAQKYSQEKRGYDINDRDYFKKTYDYLKKKNIDTTRLEEKLQTVNLYKETEDNYGSQSAHYDEKNNKVVFVNENDLYHETFHMATKGLETINKDGSKKAVGINEGITDLLATKIKENVPTNYVLQMISAKVLEKIYGEDIFIPYFNASYKQFINQFEDKEKIAKLIMDLDIYHEIHTSIRDEKLLPSFYTVLEDLIEISKDLPKEEFNDIIDMIEDDLERPGIADVMGYIELGRNKRLNIRKDFSLGTSRQL